MGREVIRTKGKTMHMPKYPGTCMPLLGGGHAPSRR